MSVLPVIPMQRFDFKKVSYKLFLVLILNQYLTSEVQTSDFVVAVL